MHLDCATRAFACRQIRISALTRWSAATRTVFTALKHHAETSSARNRRQARPAIVAIRFVGSRRGPAHRAIECLRVHQVHSSSRRKTGLSLDLCAILLNELASSFCKLSKKHFKRVAGRTELPMSSVLDEFLEGFEPSPQIVSVMAGARPATVLGLDIGTSGVRAALFDEQGGEIQDASVRLSRSPLDDLTLLDAEESLALVVRTIDHVLDLAEPNDFKIQIISVSCFWHSLVGVDESGRATTPIFTWASTKATAAAQELRESFDERSVHSRTGCRFHPSYWPAKLRWLHQARPQFVENTRQWMSFGEFLVLRLFGETAVSVSMASGTGLFNQRRCEWDVELLESLGFGLETLPKLAGPHTTFQGLIGKFAERWPQLSEAKLFPAIGDGAANAIGSGCSTRDSLALMVGSSGALRVLYKGEPPTALPAELWCYRADAKRVVVGGALSDGGNLYGWFRDSLLLSDDDPSIERALALLEPDAHGLTILPFWSGERSTGWSLTAKGTILGLTGATQSIEILQAAMEAVAYRFALIYRALLPFASNATVVASGTALRASKVWSQILADVLGTPITLSAHRESSTLGAALLALEAAGKIANIESRAVVPEITFEPDMFRHERYRAGLERQQELYEQLVS
jgi:gluconokinase